MKALVGLMLLACLSCGAPPDNFSGHWTGTETLTNQCGDQPSGTLPSTSVEFAITQSGSTVTVVRNHCSFALVGSGETASLPSTFDCPVASDDQGTWVTHYTSASLTLNGSTLLINFHVTSDNSDYDGSSYTCTSSETGVLQRG